MAAACAVAAPIPRVALMFLTRGPLPYEQLWTEWFRDVTEVLPLEGLQMLGCSSERLQHVRKACSVGSRHRPLLDRQLLFTVYNHPHPEFPGFPPGSLFHGREVADRVATKWGSPSLMDATQRLLRAAVAEPSNQRFVLLCESSIPLYPPAVVYQQLMGETLSRINACKGWWVNHHEWVVELGDPGTNFTHGNWRKSSQWFVLTRPHAEIIAADTHFIVLFKQHCRPHFNLRTQRWRQCYTDEHYLPSVLARHGLDNQTDCHGGVMSTDWTADDWHPETYTATNVSAAMLVGLRHNVFFGAVPKPGDKRQGPPRDQCHDSAAIAHARRGFAALEDLAATSCAAEYRWDPGLLAHQCPLFARKFGNDTETVDAVLDAVHECSEHRSNILGACKV